MSYLPDISDYKALLRQNILAAKRHPRRYFGTLIYTLIRVKPTLMWRFLQACHVANEAQRLRLDHLHAHFATRATSVAFLASMISHISYSFTGHAIDIYKEKLSRRALVKKIENARFVVTVSDYNKTYLERLANYRSGKIVRIYNGIDLTRFVPNGVPARSPFTILCVARLAEKKGLPVLIQACRRLHSKGVTFQCWIVGHGPKRARLEALISRWKLHEHVHLLGPHTQLEVLKRYQSSHLFVLPAIVGSNGNREGLPVSIVEALACGLPVVSTPITGIPEVVRDQHNGLLVPEGDSDALTLAIESVMQNIELYERLQANTRPSVTANFDVRQTTEALQRLFEEG